jgi:hypothetical protein
MIIKEMFKNVSTHRNLAHPNVLLRLNAFGTRRHGTNRSENRWHDRETFYPTR